MLYIYSKNNNPLQFEECGQLHSHEPFIHVRRSMDLFIMIIVCEGTLYISQEQNFYEVHPNQFVILLPNTEHYGHLPSAPGLSYYWCHFRIPDYQLISKREAESFKQTTFSLASLPDHYLLPETGSLYTPEKVSQLFRLMMDTSKQLYFKKVQGNYAMSLIVLEIMQSFLTHAQLDYLQNSACTIQEIEEWIRINCTTDLSIHDIAQFFGYNVNYLSSLFKRRTGYSLKRYICVARITLAKQKLLNSSDQVKTIAFSVGFSDEKQFMKVFKQLEGITPTQYRNLYYKKSFSPQLR